MNPVGTSPLVSQLLAGVEQLSFIFAVEMYSYITTALWSRGGSAAVSVHPPAASMKSGMQFLQPSTLLGVFGMLVRRVSSEKILKSRPKVSVGWSCRSNQVAPKDENGPAVLFWMTGGGRKCRVGCGILYGAL